MAFLLVAIYISFIGLGVLKLSLAIGQSVAVLLTDETLEPEELSPCFEVEKGYAKDTTLGGLFGPIEIYIRR